MKFKKLLILAVIITASNMCGITFGQQKKPMPAKQVENLPASQQGQNPASFEARTTETESKSISEETPKEILADRFADVQVLRYAIPGFSELSLNQKKLAYYLYEAGLCGRDIFWDQKYKNNLMIRKALENILNTYKGDRKTAEWKKFETYCKQVFFANGIHHHYSNAKIMPAFSVDYFKVLMRSSDQSNLVGVLFRTNDDAYGKIADVIFSAGVDMKSVDLSAGIDNVKASCNNFYEGVSQKEVEDFYNKMGEGAGEQAPSFGLNSKVIKEDGVIKEKVWKAGGMYGPAMEQMVKWLRKAEAVAENETQRNTLHKLADYFETGDLKKFDEYNLSWISDTSSRIDVTLGFIEVYNDAISKKGSYESVVSMKDMEASKMIAKIAAQAQWFEDNSPLMAEHKKKNVTGISAKVITVIGESGSAAPVTPIGINLPNAEWIREVGSKSVSLGNIVTSYNYTRAKSPMIDEFGSSPEVIARVKKYGAVCGELHTDMHEVIGHASGQLNPGVATTDITLKNYASTLEEARADLVALYYIMDKKLIDIGVMSSLEVGKAQYDSYILNGLMTQLYRIRPGDNIEESHMRNRQLISKWALEKGASEKIIERTKRGNKTYFVINDYEKLRTLFGQLLREIQRIKSEGDFAAGKNLVENYGVIADQDILKEVHARYEKLDIAPYMGFIQPKLIPVFDANKNITDVKVDCNQDFMKQMLEYGKKYAFLPVMN